MVSRFAFATASQAGIHHQQWISAFAEMTPKRLFLTNVSSVPCSEVVAKVLKCHFRRSRAGGNPLRVVDSGPQHPCPLECMKCAILCVHNNISQVENVMHMFGIRDLRERSSELTKAAEAGQLSLFTKRDRPFMVGIPFSEDLLKEGVNVSLAAHLYEQGVLSPAKAARLAKCSLEVFIQTLGHLGITLIDYDADELDEELNNLG